MLLTQTTLVPDAALPLQALKDHLRLGTGFGQEGMQDGLLLGFLRASLAAIEGRIGKATIGRDYLLTLHHWRGSDAQALPMAPATALLSLTLVDAEGVAAPFDLARLRLVKDTHRPMVSSKGQGLPQIPSDGQVEIGFSAGFGDDWADVPADLRQAVLMLAAEYYATRHEDGFREDQGLPYAVVTLIERWRNVRILGAGAR